MPAAFGPQFRATATWFAHEARASSAEPHRLGRDCGHRGIDYALCRGRPGSETLFKKETKRRRNRENENKNEGAERNQKLKAKGGTETQEAERKNHQTKRNRTRQNEPK